MSLPTVNRESSQDPSNGRVDRPSIDRDTGVGGNLEPGSVAGNEKQVLEPKGLLHSNREAGKIVDVSRSLSSFDDGV
eukprot:11199475-Lingulodinium_polyedra.AAC.1